ncbi:hypothetical protein GQF03_08330 [Sneathiella chungangensis]|uniref:RiboL-PSP-HEPN domain-containing protein n=1 Tax=Sneathiella chungangensis TaxID=1418234 RepID=A0A845MF97_9PROT|nr:HEPN domain-containing protein [Sneathiella chungangensis]MZR22335.1 hypothetical protein [Sneathiella chungangensis]
MSQALRKFERNFGEVSGLLEAYEIVREAQGNNNQRGRVALGHITKSAVVILCSAWQVYIEDIIRESTIFICQRCSSLSDERLSHLSVYLNNHLKSAFASNNAKLSDKAMSLIENDWVKNVKGLVDEELVKFNTPKSPQVEKIFSNIAGVSKNEFPWIRGNCWDYLSNEGRSNGIFIDDLVSRRGGIAHGDGNIPDVRKHEIDDYSELTKRQIIAIDNWLYNSINEKYGRRPWKVQTCRFKDRRLEPHNRVLRSFQTRYNDNLRSNVE